MSELSQDRQGIERRAPGALIAPDVPWNQVSFSPRSSKEMEMDALDPYATVLAVLSVSLLLIAAGVGKKQLVWKQRKPLLVRSRRRRS